MKDRSVYIATTLECIDLIKDYTSGFTLENFLADRKTQDAVIRNLEIIGQALKDYGTEALIEKDPTSHGCKLPECEMSWLTNI